MRLPSPRTNVCISSRSTILIDLKFSRGMFLTNMNTLAVHLYHDSTISMNLAGEFRNIELERVYAKRHYDWRQENESLDELFELIREEQNTFDCALVVGPHD